MLKAAVFAFAVGTLVVFGLMSLDIPVAEASKQKPKVPEHACCHNGQCCGTQGCCDKKGCHSAQCPKIKGKDRDKKNGSA